MSETLSVIFDGEVFRPEKPVKFLPNTRYEITVSENPLSKNDSRDSDLLRSYFHFMGDEKKIAEFLEQASFVEAELIRVHEAIKNYFPDARLELSNSDIAEFGANKLIVVINTQQSKNEIRQNFNRFKSEWWFHTSEELRELVTLVIESPESSTRKSLETLNGLAGSVEAPPDFALEHDHYIYGSPKRH